MEHWVNICTCSENMLVLNSLSHLSCSKDSHIALILPEEGQVTSREVILLLSFACGQVKDAVPYPVTSFQHCVDS